MPDELDALAGQLTECLAGLGSALIAFSGGVDSSLVAALAARALGDRALAVTAVSPALASGELDGARSVARADVGPPDPVPRPRPIARMPQPII